jgi:hypothetical protein
MNWKALFGELIKAIGILITFFPLIVFLLGLYLGFIIGAMAIVLPVMLGSIVLLIPCNMIGKSLYKAGLAIEMEAKGVKSAIELRKSMNEILEAKSAEDSCEYEIPDSNESSSKPKKKASKKGKN